jgi:serpin B
MKPVTLSRRHFLAASAAALFAPRLRAEAPPRVALAEGNAAFGYDLYAKLAAEDAGNLFFSPFSISTALAMTAAGAKGTTLDEMKKALHLPPDAHAGFADLLKRVNGTGEKRAYQLTTANALFAQTGYPWRQEFADLTRKNYGAGLVDTDFKADAEGSRLRINSWVEKETKEKIKDLIPAGVIKELTRMVLTNAVHFKGNWASQFKKEATKDAQFHTAGTKTAEVPMMNQQGTFGYGEFTYSHTRRSGERAQVVELPYVGRELSMLVFLPETATDLPVMESKLSAKMFDQVSRQLKSETVSVSLPRFKMEWGTRSLVDPLKALGMKAVFGAAADLTGMHSGSEPLYVSDVVHKAFVDVNEEGTEAAAATAAVVGLRGFSPPPPKVFRADRPFVFLIRENATGSVLFLGRFAGPK